MTARRLIATVRMVISGYGRHADSQHAAAISYRFLFSIVPFLALLTAVLDLVLPADNRERIVQWLLDIVPGTSTLDRGVDQTIAGAGFGASIAGLIALGGLLWGASGMMSAIRTAFRVIWEDAAGIPFVRGKLLDFTLVVAAGILIVAGFGLSLVAQVIQQVGEQLSRTIGAGDHGRLVGTLAGVALALVLMFAALLLLYRVAAPVRPQTSGLVLAASVGAIALQITMAGFSFYLDHVANFNAVYGSLGALFGLLVLVYISAIVLLVGAETAVAWPASSTQAVAR